MSKYFYAVRTGKVPGIYNTWSECEKEVKGFKGAEFKKFKTKEEALEFIEGSKEGELKKEEIESHNFLSGIPKDTIVAYVDGSFLKKDMVYSYGVVIITDKKVETFKGMENDPSLVNMRNVSGELKGAMVAISIALERNYRRLLLHYDYAGIEKWALGEWKTNKTGTKNYKKYYDSIKDKLHVSFIKVKAHTGVEYNELADKLAKEAIEEGVLHL